MCREAIKEVVSVAREQTLLRSLAKLKKWKEIEANGATFIIMCSRRALEQQRAEQLLKPIEAHARVLLVFCFSIISSSMMNVTISKPKIEEKFFQI